ncbi:hypothetical protein SFRURICE_015163 [Spodoptera frugiperda]|nr:hypothetical protein SFRURICE_015163 [Spodoptera frugiperda]
MTYYQDDTQTRNHNLWGTLRVAKSGNRFRCTLRSSRLLSHRANRAVEMTPIKYCSFTIKSLHFHHATHLFTFLLA